jgi:hypothetical protein
MGTTRPEYGGGSNPPAGYDNPYQCSPRMIAHLREPQAALSEK